MVDVLVIGGGNAALCAALTAREAGASVLLLEAARENGAAEILSTHETCAVCMMRRRMCWWKAILKRNSGRICGESPTATPTRRWRGWSFAPLRNAATGCANMALTFNRHYLGRSTLRAPMRFYGRRESARQCLLP